MADTITDIAITDLTTGTINGAGIFDKMMAATKLHLEQEFNKNRITGPNYSTVYLGALNTVMGQAMQFLLQKEAVTLQAQLLAQQILVAQIEVQKAQIELEMLSIAKLKASAEVLQIQSQTALSDQQKINLVKELDKTVAEIAQVNAQTDMVNQQKLNAIAEGLNIPKQGLLLDAQICKLKADYDLTVNTNLRTTQEIELTIQKTLTEKAQTTAVGVDANSVVGKQKALYQAQTDGFTRDAEQKMAKILVDTWSARRMSDDGTVADGVNMLQDTTIGRAINKLLAGVGA